MPTALQAWIDNCAKDHRLHTLQSQERVSETTWESLNASMFIYRDLVSHSRGPGHGFTSPGNWWQQPRGSVTSGKCHGGPRI